MRVAMFNQMGSEVCKTLRWTIHGEHAIVHELIQALYCYSGYTSFYTNLQVLQESLIDTLHNFFHSYIFFTVYTLSLNAYIAAGNVNN